MSVLRLDMEVEEFVFLGVEDFISFVIGVVFMLLFVGLQILFVVWYYVYGMCKLIVFGEDINICIVVLGFQKLVEVQL